MTLLRLFVFLFVSCCFLEISTLEVKEPPQEPKLHFDLEKMQQIYDNYNVNFHPGVTLVMGHPFKNEEFCKLILEEQHAIKNIFMAYGLENLLNLYKIDSQVHATLIELASQHDKEKTDQQFLSEEELSISSKTKQGMNLDYFVYWIKKTEPFEIELGPDVLSNEHQEQTLRITDTGQIVMKGRAKDRKLLAEIRAEFEKEAGIVHKYGKEDDAFFFVIGYLRPDPRLNDPLFRHELERCIQARRANIRTALKVDAVKVIMYQNYSLDQRACVWESKEYKLSEDPPLPQKTLIDSIKAIIKTKMPLTSQGPSSS